MDVCKELKVEKKPHTFSQKVDCPNTFIMIVFPRSDFEKRKHNDINGILYKNEVHRH